MNTLDLQREDQALLDSLHQLDRACGPYTKKHDRAIPHSCLHRRGAEYAWSNFQHHARDRLEPQTCPDHPEQISRKQPRPTSLAAR